MLPLARFCLAGCLTAVATGLFAQDNLSTYPGAPAPLNHETEQQALARQYLAAPPGWASAEDQPGMPPAANTRDVRTANTPPGKTPVAASSDSRTTFEQAIGPNRAYGPVDSLSADAGNPSSDPVNGEPRPTGPAPASQVDESAPPQLLSLPEVPARAAYADATVPHAGNRATADQPGLVTPVAHFSEESDNSAPRSPAEHGPDDSPKNTATEAETSQPVPIPLEEARDALPLEPPGVADSESGSRPTSGMPSMVTMIGGLGIVLGLFGVVAWGMRRATPGATMTLPKQVVEVLGRAPLAGRHQVHLLRCGNKLLLVSVTPDATESLTEITDPFEVDRLAGLCEQARPNSSSASFRRAFQQFAHEGKGSYAS